MSDLYNKILELCMAHGIKPGKMCADLNISRGMISDLKMGRTKELSAKNLAKIAEYFNVTVDFLYGNEKKEAPTLTKKDERDIARDLETIIVEMSENGDLMFDGLPMSDEAKESIIAAMKLGLEAAKLKNKEKYTPKKRRS